MTDPSAFDTPSRREEARELHEELINRLHQRGLRVDESAPDGELADLLSAMDAFEAAVEDAGGDLFIDAPDSSEPERPEFVVPHQHEDETVKNYIKRIRAATERVRKMR